MFDNKDDFNPSPHPNLLRMPFSLLEIAQKGSGKTMLLINLLTWYAPYFDNIFIWSPTINLDRKWEQIIEKLRIPKENLFDNYNDNVVSGLMRKIKDFNKNRKEKEKIQTLFIFDDMVQYLPTTKVNALNKLCMNHRHYKISHIIISQSFKKLPPVVRSNTTGMILFNTDNSTEREKIIEELSGNIGKKDFEKLFIETTIKKYSFLYINYDTRKIYSNFDKEIADLSIPPKYLFQ